MTELKGTGIVHFLNVQVIQHTMIEKIGKDVKYTVVLENLVSKDRIKFESPSSGIFTQYPLAAKFAVEIKTPQSALSDFVSKEVKGIE